MSTDHSHHGPAHGGHAHAEHPEPHPHHPHGTGHGGDPIPEPENIQVAPLALVAIVSVLTFVIGSIWALRIRANTEREMNPSLAAALPPSLGAEEQGIVDQIPFELNHWVKDDRRHNGLKLQGYGWVDQKAGTIHIPIERAMELVQQEANKEPRK
jgi:hypothetical protein